MKIAFLINGLICNKKKITQEIEQAFSSFSYEFFVSEYAGHMITLCHEVIEKGFDALAVVGGDGTINEVVNGIITKYKSEEQFDWQAIQKIKLIIIPRGGGNDFSKMLYKNNSLRRISELIQQNQFKLTDVGQADFQDFEQQPAQRFFINITDIGIGGDVVQKRDKVRRWMPSNLNYSYSILSTFLTYKKKAVKVIWDSKEWTGKAMGIVIANGKYFGSGLGIAPKAITNDGTFSLVRLGDISVIDYLQNLSTVKKCEPISHPEVHYFTAKQISINTTNNTLLPIDMDGEYVGYAPLQIDCLKERLLVLQEK